MMKRIRLIFLLLAVLGCSPNEGIETGNPDLDLEGKKVIITPESGDFDYAAFFLDGGEVRVTQANKAASAALSLKAQAVVETVTVSYAQTGNRAVFEAAFSNGVDVRVYVSFTDAGDVDSASLILDGALAEADFRVARCNDNFVEDCAALAGEASCEAAYSTFYDAGRNASNCDPSEPGETGCAFHNCIWESIAVECRIAGASVDAMTCEVIP